MSDYDNLEVTSRKKKILSSVLVLFGVVTLGILAMYGIVQQGSSDTLSSQAVPVPGAQAVPGAIGTLSYTYTYSRVVIGEGFECNDGTDAIFYIDEADASSPNADKWMIELEGGATCNTVSDCEDRWETRSQDMTTDYSATATFGSDGGLASADPDLNPYFYDYNRVVIHYCTSDSHMGQVTQEESGTEWSFLGANNAFGMLDRLSTDYPEFNSAGVYLFTGYSVGGTGVLNLADGFVEYLKALNPQGESFFVSDCGWNLMDWDCFDGCEDVVCLGDECDGSDSSDTEEEDDIDKHYYYNANCQTSQEKDSDCSYGEIVFHYIDNLARVVVSQQLYDSQMLPWDRFIPVSDWTDEQIDFCYDRTDYVIETYENQGVHSAFSSNCRTHDFIENGNVVYDTTVSDTSLPSLLNDFINSNGEPFGLYVDEDHYPEANPTCDLTILDSAPSSYEYMECAACEE